MMTKFLPDERFLPQAVMLTAAATNEILISSYKLEHTMRQRGDALRVLFEALVAAKRKGVKVKVLLNWNDLRRSVAKTNLYAMKWLKSHDIESRYLKDNRCCHAKIIIVDRKSVILGSHNLSCKSVMENHETSVLLDDAEIVQQAHELFLRVWENAISAL
jgi:phosphatidylserine/phosphatidylglycerophosphate/cardiolipin synthase-like enzyme